MSPSAQMVAFKNRIRSWAIGQGFASPSVWQITPASEVLGKRYVVTTLVLTDPASSEQSERSFVVEVADDYEIKSIIPREDFVRVMQYERRTLAAQDPNRAALLDAGMLGLVGLAWSSQ